MSIHRKRLPSISMLAAFDAAARTGSISAAARELNVTHGAISRQVHALEAQLDVTLFHRTARGLKLTDVGERYARDVHSAISTLRNASMKIMSDPTGSSIDLAVLPSFCTRWLIPRLPMFLENNPDITVNFVAQPSPERDAFDSIDAVIYDTEEDWPGTDSLLLMGEASLPVCAPMLLREKQTDLAVALRELPLLGLKSRPGLWADWFAAGNLDWPAGKTIMQFEQFSALAQAAVAGIGVALLPRFLVATELERGILVELSERRTISETAYFLVTPKAKQSYQPLLRFRQWLLDTIDREKQPGQPR